MFTRERELENMVVKVGSEVDGPPVLHQAAETSCAAADIQHLPPTEFEKCCSFEIGQELPVPKATLSPVFDPPPTGRVRLRSEDAFRDALQGFEFLRFERILFHFKRKALPRPRKTVTTVSPDSTKSR